MRLICPLLVALLVFPFAAFGFLPPTDTAGPLTISIAGPGEVDGLGKPLSGSVSLKNDGALTIDGTVRLGVTDDWRISPPSRSFSLPAHGTQSIAFEVTPAESSYAALYPIHPYADFRQAGVAQTAHAILITSVSPAAVASMHPPAANLPLLTLSIDGRVALDAPGIFRPSIALLGINPVAKPIGWTGTDPATGAFIALQQIDRGGQRHAIAVHPAWRHGWGDVFLDYRVALPAQKPATLAFATAIRDNIPPEPPSDGVEYRVLVSDGGPFQTLFTRFSAAKRWEYATVDLSAFAGKSVTLRLVTDPGPAHDTTCDQSYWAQPVITSGTRPVAEPESARLARQTNALALAGAAFRGNTSPWSWKIASNAGITGAGIVPGPCGLADAFIAFSDGARSVVFDGFNIQVDGSPVGTGDADLPCLRVESRFDSGRGVITAAVNCDGATIPVQTIFWAEKGALRIAFSIPGVQRDLLGEPRFTSLAIGPASQSARRVYAGFGNVVQNPGSFDLPAGGFTLSTRHVGIDFANGLSLVQATDIFPDSFHVDPPSRTYALVAHHDATFSLIPSAHQAFAAARVYHDLVDFQPAAGVARLQGRICLDQWGGDYRQDAIDLKEAAAYGLTDAVFVKHVWQRWGYDYRLPDIYPPAGSMDDFLAMVSACKAAGILYCPHDNYIDFYPDAPGFSYDHILFNEDGTPQKAWLNEGRGAQSYRWSPLEFGPWLEANLRKVKAGFAPTAYFVDVFSAMPPIDFHDRQGRFYPKTVTAARWGAAFDRIREILGNNAPTISEAGQDGLIGHLDAGESDHAGWDPGTRKPGDDFSWHIPAADAERVPWHDMASHGSFVLLGGGLGNRYASGQDEFLHGYGSDDYLCTTVLGGRNPMCDGPFSRRSVMTYWLLHDLCNSVARSQLLSDEFAGDDIHRQIVRFSNGATAWVNRGSADWIIGDPILPQYGFIARAGDCEAGITRRDGIISAYASSPGSLFVDARPESTNTGEGGVIPKVLAIDDLGNRRFRLHIDWQVLAPVPAGYRPFVHFVNDDAATNEGILFQGALNLDPAKLAQAGTYSSTCEVTIPDNLSSPAGIAIRFGLYRPAPDGARLPLLIPVDRDRRARGGVLHVTASAITWTPEPPDPDFLARRERLNTSARILNFGPTATNGAFRLLHAGPTWQLIPLPGSYPFDVDLHLDQLNASGSRVISVQSLQDAGASSGAPIHFQQTGATLRFHTTTAPFGYKIAFAQ